VVKGQRPKISSVNGQTAETAGKSFDKMAGQFLSSLHKQALKTVLWPYRASISGTE